MNNKGILPLPTYTKGRGPKKKTNLFSMNIYRNMHYLSLNKVKKDYHEVVKEWAKTLPKYKTIFPKYKIYFKGKRKKDIDNFTFPLHKFLMDALVEYDIIEDDDYTYVKGFTTEFGGIEEHNFVVVELTGEQQ
jgi:hypothetical protein